MSFKSALFCLLSLFMAMTIAVGCIGAIAMGDTFFKIAGQYGTSRVENACTLMRTQGRAFTLESLRHMLAHNLDSSPLKEQIISVTHRMQM